MVGCDVVSDSSVCGSVGVALMWAVRGVGGAFNDNQINKSAYFNEYNRNKKSLVIDLKSEVGKKAVLKLITSADVFVENWSSGVAKRLGFDYEKLKKINPSLVYVSMPGFGHEGSDSNRVGYGPGIEQMGGLVWLQGYDSKEPHKRYKLWLLLLLVSIILQLITAHIFCK